MSPRLSRASIASISPSVFSVSPSLLFIKSGKVSGFVGSGTPVKFNAVSATGMFGRGTPESVLDFSMSGLFVGSFASGETVLFQAATLVADGALLGL